jgi:hypothetical protein
MTRKEDYDWATMTDERLAIRRKEEEWNAQHKNKRVDRAIARKNVDAIVHEQIRRYEEKFLGKS